MVDALLDSRACDWAGVGVRGGGFEICELKVERVCGWGCGWVGVWAGIWSGIWAGVWFGVWSVHGRCAWWEVVVEVEEGEGGFAGGVVDAPGDAGVFVFVGGVGGDCEEASCCGGFDLGCDGAGADGGELFEEGEVVLGLVGLDPSEEVFEGQVVGLAEGEEALVGGEEVGEEGGVVDGLRAGRVGRIGRRPY